MFVDSELAQVDTKKKELRQIRHHSPSDKTLVKMNMLMIWVESRETLREQMKRLKIHVTYRSSRPQKNDEDFYESRECVKSQVWQPEKAAMKFRRSTMFALLSIWCVRCNMNNFDPVFLLVARIFRGWSERSWPSENDDEFLHSQNTGDSCRRLLAIFVRNIIIWSLSHRIYFIWKILFLPLHCTWKRASRRIINFFTRITSASPFWSFVPMSSRHY